MLSIITINYNNAEGLLRSMESVKSQTYKEFEYIVIDGNSDDRSLEVIRENDSILSRWISEDDQGIYNAMNKGVRLATKKYCLFLNSGDVLYSRYTLENLALETMRHDFILGAVISPRIGHIRAKSDLALSDFYFGSIPHQSSIISRQLLIDYPYDESLKIVSDWKFAIERLIFDQVSYQAITEIIAIEEGQGISDGISRTHQEEREKVMRDLLPKGIIKDYNAVMALYKNPLKYIRNLLW